MYRLSKVALTGAGIALVLSLGATGYQYHRKTKAWQFMAPALSMDPKEESANPNHPLDWTAEKLHKEIDPILEKGERSMPRGSIRVLSERKFRKECGPYATGCYQLSDHRTYLEQENDNRLPVYAHETGHRRDLGFAYIYTELDELEASLYQLLVARRLLKAGRVADSMEVFKDGMNYFRLEQYSTLYVVKHFTSYDDLICQYIRAKSFFIRKDRNHDIGGVILTVLAPHFDYDIPRIYDFIHKSSYLQVKKLFDSQIPEGGFDADNLKEGKYDFDKLIANHYEYAMQLATQQLSQEAVSSHWRFNRSDSQVMWGEVYGLNDTLGVGLHYDMRGNLSSARFFSLLRGRGHFDLIWSRGSDDWNEASITVAAPHNSVPGNSLDGDYSLTGYVPTEVPPARTDIWKLVQRLDRISQPGAS